jgi:RNA polymerase sigma-70 factor (ECF subfamily)
MQRPEGLSVSYAADQLVGFAEMTRTEIGLGSVDGSRTLEELLVPVLPRAYSFALHLTRNEADAEDLLQEAATRACRFLHQFRPGTNFGAWFFRILKNCFYNLKRQDRRRGERISIEDASELHRRTAVAGLNEWESNPATAFLARLDAQQIATALDALPGEFRTVASLFFVDGLTYDQISEVLDIPLGTVRSRLHRGRRILQKELRDAALEHGLVLESANE